MSAPRTPTRIIRLGRCKLWLRDGETAKLDLTIRDGEIFRDADPGGSMSRSPKLAGWACFFVGRYPDRTVWTYRRTAS